MPDIRYLVSVVRGAMFRHIALPAAVISATALIISGPALADLSMPQLTSAADAYQKILTARTTEAADPMATLAATKAAEVARDWPAVVRYLEALVGATPDNFDLWHRLALTVMDHLPDSEYALAIGYSTYRAAGDKPRKTEALLILGRMVRNRLDQVRTKHDNLSVDVQDLTDEIEPQTPGDPGTVDLTFPTIETLDGQPGKKQGQVERSASMKAQLDGLSVIGIEYTRLLSIAHHVYLELFTLLERPLDERLPPWNELKPSYQEQIRLEPNDVIWRSGRDTLSACLKPTVVPTGTAEEYKSRWIEVREHGVDDAAEDPGRLVQNEVVIDKEFICLLGLMNGRIYSIKLKRGMPLTEDVPLPRDIVLPRRAAPDLPPTIQLQSAAYVVPLMGQRLVPMQTVNVNRLDLELVRISDRTIYRRIALRQIGKAMKAGEIAEIYRNFSDPFWKGELRLGGQASNRITTTNLPIFKLIEERRQWIRGERKTGAISSSIATADGFFSNGRFYDDPANYQSRNTGPTEPGVYALLVRPAGDATTGIGTDVEYPIQWFVFTDIALTFWRGEEKLYVLARSLATGEPIEDAQIQLLARNNRVLGKMATDNRGVATFPGSLAKGSHGNGLAAVVAYDRADFAFVDLVQDGLDLSRLDIGGRIAPGKFDAFVHTDRGVYRPGSGDGAGQQETVRAFIMVRDAAGDRVQLPAPLRVHMRSARGVMLDERIIPPDRIAQQMGGAVIELAVPSTAPFGTAVIEVMVGDQTKAIGRTEIQIAHLRPDRARLLFDAPEQWTSVIGPEGTYKLEGKLTAQYLQSLIESRGDAIDMPATHMTGEINVLLQPAETPFGKCFHGFAFGHADTAFKPYLIHGTLGASDESGRMQAAAEVRNLPIADVPLEAKVTASVQDEAGHAASRVGHVPVRRDANWLGIRRGGVRELGQGRFDVSLEAVLVDMNGRGLSGADVSYQLYRERPEFLWYNQDGDWNYRADVTRIAVSDARGSVTAAVLAADACGEANVKLPPLQLDAGDYVLELSTAKGRASFRFPVGASSAGTMRPEPHLLKIFSSKSQRTDFTAGETAEFVVHSPFEGKVLAAVVIGGEVAGWYEAETDNRTVMVNVPVPEVWRGRTAHLVATVFRRAADGTEARGPQRAIGALPFTVELARRGLSLTLDGTPNRITPTSGLRVRLTAEDERKEKFTGKAMVALFAVDEGLINLTEHPLPAPFEHFHGRRRLAFDIHDTYNRLLLTSSRDVNSGGDANLFARLLFNNYLSERIVALHAARDVEFTDGVATMEDPSWNFQNFAGTVRLAAIVWTGERVAAASQNVLVRDLIVARLGLPRFLAPGDKPEVPLVLENVEGLDDTYHLSFSGREIRRVLIPGTENWQELDDLGNGFDLQLPRGQRKMLYLQLAVDEDEREQPLHFELRLNGRRNDNPAQLAWVWRPHKRLSYVPAVHVLAREEVPPSKSLKLTIEQSKLAQIRRPQVQARFTGRSLPMPPRMPPSLLTDIPRTLDRLVWSAMLLPAERGAGLDTEEAYKRIVQSLLALQHETGAFLPYKADRYSSSTELEYRNPDRILRYNLDELWSSALAIDLLREAKTRGLPVDEAVAKGIQYLQGELRSRLFPANEKASPREDSQRSTALPAPADSPIHQPTDETLLKPQEHSSGKTGPLDGSAPGTLGVRLGNLTGERIAGLSLTGREAEILEVPAESPAQAAGLLAGDIIVSIDNLPAGSEEELLATIAKRPAGSAVVLRILRAGGVKDDREDVRVILGKADETDAGQEEQIETKVENVPCTRSLGYAANVLVRLGELRLADMVALAKACGADTQLGAIATPEDAQITTSPLGELIAAATLSAFGKPQEAASLLKVFRENLSAGAELESGVDQGESIAIALVILNRLQSNAPEVHTLATSLPASLSLPAQAWLARFAGETQLDSDIAIALEPEAIGGVPLIELTDAAMVSTRFLRPAEIIDNALTVRNRGSRALTATLFARGIRRAPLQPGVDAAAPEDQSVKFTRRFLKLDGTPFGAGDLSLRQNDVVAVVIEGEGGRAPEGGDAPSLLLIDMLPSGFEIVAADSPTATSKVLPNPQGAVVYSEERDDKYVAVVKTEGQLAQFRVIYYVRASTPGEFGLPQTRVEDLRQPELGAFKVEDQVLRISRH